MTNIQVKDLHVLLAYTSYSLEMASALGVIALQLDSFSLQHMLQYGELIRRPPPAPGDLLHTAFFDLCWQRRNFLYWLNAQPVACPPEGLRAILPHLPFPRLFMTAFGSMDQNDNASYRTLICYIIGFRFICLLREIKIWINKTSLMVIVSEAVLV